MNDVLIRAAIALGIICAGLGSFQLYGVILLRRAAASAVADFGLPHAGASRLLYFTTPTCVPCKTIQKPAIQQVKGKLGESLEVIEVDATERPELADRWGVMSVPTTYVIDPAGQVRHVNHGVARAEKLMKQVLGS